MYQYHNVCLQLCVYSLFTLIFILCSELRTTYKAVRIELFNARVFYRVSYRVVEYSSTRMKPEVAINYTWSKTNGHMAPHLSL